MVLRVSKQPKEDILWFHAKCLGKELIDFITLVSLELKNLSQFLTSDNSPVACEILHRSASDIERNVNLLESFQDLLLIILCRKTLDRSQRLATVALLDTDMNVVLDINLIYEETYATGTGG
jgi:hypothetical protein